MTLDTMMVLAVATLHDEFDFGAKRCQRFIDRMVKKADCMLADMVTWQDYITSIEAEMGIRMNIRRND